MRHTHVTAILPRLRRHALILAGDRTAADDTVYRCLERYRSNPARVRPERAAVDMFRLFHDVLTVPVALVDKAPRRDDAPNVVRVAPAPRPMAPAGVAATASAQGAMLRRLGTLPPAQRRVLSLVAVEGFSLDDCAHVLSLPRARVCDLLADARRALAAQAAGGDLPSAVHA